MAGATGTAWTQPRTRRPSRQDTTQASNSPIGYRRGVTGFAGADAGNGRGGSGFPKNAPSARLRNSGSSKGTARSFGPRYSDAIAGSAKGADSTRRRRGGPFKSRGNGGSPTRKKTNANGISSEAFRPRRDHGGKPITFWRLCAAAAVAGSKISKRFAVNVTKPKRENSREISREKGPNPTEKKPPFSGRRQKCLDPAFPRCHNGRAE